MLFQVHFLALLLEERGAGSLAEVAEHVRQKLIRRHPHIFGGRWRSSGSAEVLRNWDAIKATEPGREAGLFGEVPENLPGPLYARKVQRRAASSGFDFDHVPYDAVRGELEELEAAGDREAAFHEVGDVLFAAVNVARKLKVDPGARAARLGRALPRARAGGGRPRRIGRPGLARSARRCPARLLRAGPFERGASPVSQIESVHARQILDSRGNPTVEVDVALRSGAQGRAAVPSGASTGEFEATELRDGGDAYMGKGVTQGGGRTSTGRSRRPSRATTRSTRQGLDRALIELDGTPNKSRLGANAILGVSLAAARAAAAEEGCRCGATWAGTRRACCPCR